MPGVSDRPTEASVCGLLADIVFGVDDQVCRAAGLLCAAIVVD